MKFLGNFCAVSTGLVFLSIICDADAYLCYCEPYQSGCPSNKLVQCSRVGFDGSCGSAYYHGEQRDQKGCNNYVGAPVAPGCKRQWDTENGYVDVCACKGDYCNKARCNCTAMNTQPTIMTLIPDLPEPTTAPKQQPSCICGTIVYTKDLMAPSLPAQLVCQSSQAVCSDQWCKTETRYMNGKKVYSVQNCSTSSPTGEEVCLGRGYEDMSHVKYCNKTNCNTDTEVDCERNSGNSTIFPELIFNAKMVMDICSKRSLFAETLTLQPITTEDPYANITNACLGSVGLNRKCDELEDDCQRTKWINCWEMNDDYTYIQNISLNNENLYCYNCAWFSSMEDVGRSCQDGVTSQPLYECKGKDSVCRHSVIRESTGLTIISRNCVQKSTYVNSCKFVDGNDIVPSRDTCDCDKAGCNGCIKPYFPYNSTICPVQPSPLSYCYECNYTENHFGKEGDAKCLSEPERSPLVVCANHSSCEIRRTCYDGGQRFQRGCSNVGKNYDHGVEVKSGNSRTSFTKIVWCSTNKCNNCVGKGFDAIDCYEETAHSEFAPPPGFCQPQSRKQF